MMQPGQPQQMMMQPGQQQMMVTQPGQQQMMVMQPGQQQMMMQPGQQQQVMMVPQQTPQLMVPVGSPEEPEKKKQLLAGMALVWAFGFLSCILPIMTYKVDAGFMGSMESTQTFFGMCITTAGSEMCQSGRPEGKGGTGMLLTLLLMIVLGITLLLNICKWRKKMCPLIVMALSSFLCFLAAIMVGSFVSEQKDAAMGLIPVTAGPAMVTLILGGLTAVATAVGINKFG
jgi:hypothetical protein